MDTLQIDKLSNRSIITVNSNRAALDYVAQHSDAIALLGFSWLLKEQENNVDILDKIRTLSVQYSGAPEKDDKFYRPNQANLALGLYPFKRTLYVLNYQPNLGVGLGLSAFLTGDRGQRIVLKAGLLPATMPGRELIIRDDANLD